MSAIALMRQLVTPVDVDVHKITHSLAFVFVGDIYVGTVERGGLDIWKGFLCDYPELEIDVSPTMFMAIGKLITAHGVNRLKAVLGL